LAPDKSPLLTEYEAGKYLRIGLVMPARRKIKIPAGLENGCSHSLKTFHDFPHFSVSLSTKQTPTFFYTLCQPKIYPIILEPKGFRLYKTVESVAINARTQNSIPYQPNNSGITNVTEDNKIMFRPTNEGLKINCISLPYTVL
jgi:hypothetical protein